MLILSKGGCERCTPLLVSMIINEPTLYQFPYNWQPLFFCFGKGCCCVLRTLHCTLWVVAPGPCYRLVSLPFFKPLMSLLLETNEQKTQQHSIQPPPVFHKGTRNTTPKRGDFLSLSIFSFPAVFGCRLLQVEVKRKRSQTLTG